MQILVHSEADTTAYDLPQPMTIAEFFHRVQLPFPFPCGGNGTCGKCKVIAKGELSPPGAEEKQLLHPSEIAQHIRLACRTTLLGDSEIFLKPQTGHMQTATAAHTVAAATGNRSGTGAAVDIGTTTIAVQWLDLATGAPVGEDCRLNPQVQFGSDVVSRLQYAAAHGGQELQTVVTGAIDEMLAGRPEPVESLVITGNTVMLHFFTGLDTSGFNAAPFTPQSLFGDTRGKAYLPRCISAFVGADITTAILASKMLFGKSTFLVDIGTNGEMAYWDGQTLRCCSTAAGPAFEGAGLSCGMPALPGAICSVYIENGDLHYKTVDNQPPAGICGSGIIDLLACMLRQGWLDAYGYLEKPFAIGDSGIAVTPADIRQIQLAKAAIAAGIETLCPDVQALETFYIAGGFGQYINLQNAAAIGLLPKNVTGKAVILGNAALAGASMILCDSAARREAEQIAKTAETVPLSQNPAFMEAYVEHMLFE